MRDIQLSELTYVNGGESGSIPSKQEIAMNARCWGVVGGMSGGFTGFDICKNVPPSHWSSVEQQGLAFLFLSAAGTVLGYGVCYGVYYGVNSHIYQI